MIPGDRCNPIPARPRLHEHAQQLADAAVDEADGVLVPIDEAGANLRILLIALDKAVGFREGRLVDLELGRVVVLVVSGIEEYDQEEGLVVGMLCQEIHRPSQNVAVALVGS